jgi:hypothetical protein
MALQYLVERVKAYLGEKPPVCPRALRHECTGHRAMVACGPVRMGRWVCPACGGECAARRDDEGDWVYSERSLVGPRRRRAHQVLRSQEEM